MKRKIRVIIDTNIWISFLISKSYKKLDPFIFEDKILLLFSDELLIEFIDVTERNKLRSYFSRKDVAALIDLIEEYGEIISVESIVDKCRDKKDNFLLSLAKDGKADFLITGDKDLLDIQHFEKTKITTLATFIEKMK